MAARTFSRPPQLPQAFRFAACGYSAIACSTSAAVFSQSDDAGRPGRSGRPPAAKKAACSRFGIRGAATGPAGAKKQQRARPCGRARCICRFALTACGGQKQSVLFWGSKANAFRAYSTMLSPVISAGWGSPISLSMVGAISARRPPSRRVTSPAPATRNGTGLVVCAVKGVPSSSAI